jgi:hypothetical protein
MENYKQPEIKQRGPGLEEGTEAICVGKYGRHFGFKMALLFEDIFNVKEKVCSFLGAFDHFIDLI